MAQIYQEEFKDDPGAPLVQPPDYEAFREDRFQKAVAAVRSSLIPMIKSHVDPRGKAWLDIRFRTGAVLAEAQGMGARVTGVDIYDRNVEWVSRRLDCPNLHAAPFDDLLAPVTGPFDVVSMLAVHVPAHVPSPTCLFDDVYRKLAPGGLLLIDEKDATRIPPEVSVFPLRHPYGMAHYHHFTLSTATAFVQKAGFEILRAEYSPHASFLRHFFIVARKPNTRPSTSNGSIRADDPNKVYRRLLAGYFRTLWRQKRAGLSRRLVRLFPSMTRTQSGS